MVFRTQEAQVREGRGISITNKADKFQVWLGWTLKKQAYGESLIIQRNGAALFGIFNDKGHLMGEGIKLYENGDRYEGEFEDGNRHGTGTYYQ